MLKEKEIKNDRGRDSNIIKNLIEDNAKCADCLLEAKEEIREKVEDIEKMRRKHKIERENILERYEVQAVKIMAK